MTESRGEISVELQGTKSNNHIRIEYLLIKSISNPDSLHTRLTRSWLKSGSIEVGHRGCGNSFTTKNKDGKVDTNLLADQRENSINAFNVAHNIGKADMVEFDVSMTKDSIPIIYHDLTVLYNHVPTPIAAIDLSDIQTGM